MVIILQFLMFWIFMIVRLVDPKVKSNISARALSPFMTDLYGG